MEVKVIFLSDCPLVLSLLKHRGIGAFLNKKKKIPNKRSPLNSSIDNFFFFFKKTIFYSGLMVVCGYLIQSKTHGHTTT